MVLQLLKENSIAVTGCNIQEFDIETTGIYSEPGITPRDINKSSKVSNISFNNYMN